MGCDVWDRLAAIPNALQEPLGMWLPDRLRPPGTSQYVQGVEVVADFAGDLPDGFELAELPACKMMVFQGGTLRGQGLRASHRVPVGRDEVLPAGALRVHLGRRRWPALPAQARGLSGLHRGAPGSIAVGRRRRGAPVRSAPPERAGTPGARPPRACPLAPASPRGGVTFERHAREEPKETPRARGARGLAPRRALAVVVVTPLRSATPWLGLAEVAARVEAPAGTAPSHASTPSPRSPRAALDSMARPARTARAAGADAGDAHCRSGGAPCPLRLPATSRTERSFAEGRVVDDPPPSLQRRIAPWNVPCERGAGSGDG
ncbi:MAG: hypothetical protein MZU84_00880 [Sphingobacterium sp.]|nr:hypothetical protein [Sphingobacterium sp.]